VSRQVFPAQVLATALILGAVPGNALKLALMGVVWAAGFRRLACGPGSGRTPRTLWVASALVHHHVGRRRVVHAAAAGAVDEARAEALRKRGV
jgi:hypothetical protein